MELLNNACSEVNELEPGSRVTAQAAVALTCIVARFSDSTTTCTPLPSKCLMYLNMQQRCKGSSCTRGLCLRTTLQQLQMQQSRGSQTALWRGTCLPGGQEEEEGIMVSSYNHGRHTATRTHTVHEPNLGMKAVGKQRDSALCIRLVLLQASLEALRGIIQHILKLCVHTNTCKRGACSGYAMQKCMWWLHRAAYHGLHKHYICDGGRFLEKVQVLAGSNHACMCVRARRT